jgi:hypothetical protein
VGVLLLRPEGICEVSLGIADAIRKIEVGEQRLRGEGGGMPMPILEEDSTDESESFMTGGEPEEADFIVIDRWWSPCF